MSTHNTPPTHKEVKPIAPKVKELVANSKSIILGTVDAEGNPNSSYAPFVIADESDSKQIYARERLTFDVTTTQVERDSAQWDTVVEKLKEAHGKVVEVIVPMEDFIMIALNPVKGAYVNGFGSAYFVDENLDVLEHRNDINHGQKQD